MKENLLACVVLQLKMKGSRERKCPKLLKACPCGKPAVRLNNEDDFLLTSWHITTASC